MKGLSLIILALAGLALNGCGGGAEEVSSRDDGPVTGRFILEVTDAPIDDAAKVVIAYTGVEIKPVEGPSLEFDFEETKSIDLIAVTQAGIPAEILSEDIPAGDYLWFRLKVEAAQDNVLDSYIELRSGAQYELVIPSGSETGLKVNEAFTLSGNSGYGFLVDFDLARSVVESSGDYLFKPVLKATSYTGANLLSVEVAPEVISAECSTGNISDGYFGRVYLFSGLDAVPDDIDSVADEAPLYTVPVHYSSSQDPDLDDQYQAYFARFWSLPDVDYTIAFTCDASDDPEQDDPGLVFDDYTRNLIAPTFTASDRNVIVEFSGN